MTTQFEGGKPWSEITRAVRTRGPRSAAIAYVASGANELLPLRKGDVLVVNAGRSALRARATDPAVLRELLGRGIELYSCSTLHAKVIATQIRAVIGSANASTNSQSRVEEAVVISRDPNLIQSVREFISGLPDTESVDLDFLDAAQAVWDEGRPADLPGHGGDASDPPFVSCDNRLFIVGSEESHLSASGWELYEAERRRARNVGRPVSRYNLVPWMPERGDAGWRIGDAVVGIATEDEAQWVYPPAVAITLPKPIPRGRGLTMQLLRCRSDLEPLPLEEAERKLREAGVKAARPLYERRVVSASVRAAVLALWGLP